jgi:hypothetical protein
MANVYHPDVGPQSNSFARATGPESTEIPADHAECALPSAKNVEGQSAPVPMLPPELLRCIFIFLHESYLTDLEYDANDGDGSLQRTFRAAQDVHRHMLVCKTWKSHILEIPELWSTIYLKTYEFSVKPESSMARFRRWKAHSRDAPLHIGIASHTAENLVSSWVEIIRPDIARLATIGLYVAVEGPLSRHGVRTIRNDLNHASNLTRLEIQRVRLEPEIYGILQVPCIQSLLAFRAMGVLPGPPLIKMPSLRSLVLERCMVSSAEDLWKLLTTSSHLETIHFNQVRVGGLSNVNPSWTPDPSMLALQNLHLVVLENSPFMGQDKFLEALLLAGKKGSLKGLALRGMPSALVFHLHPSGPAFPYLTTLILSLKSKEPTALPMMGLLVWLKQAHVLKQLAFNPGLWNPGFAELLLQMLSIPPQSGSGTPEVVCPSLNLLVLGDNHAPVSIRYPHSSFELSLNEGNSWEKSNQTRMTICSYRVIRDFSLSASISTCLTPFLVMPD